MALFHCGATLRSAAAVAPRVPTRKSSAAMRSRAGRVQNPFGKAAGKSLLGAEHEQRRMGRRSGCAALPIDGSRERRCDGRAITRYSRRRPAASSALLRRRRGDAAHGVDHRAKLPDALDPRAISARRRSYAALCSVARKRPDDPTSASDWRGPACVVQTSRSRSMSATTRAGERSSHAAGSVGTLPIAAGGKAVEQTRSATRAPARLRRRAATARTAAARGARGCARRARSAACTRVSGTPPKRVNISSSRNCA